MVVPAAMPDTEPLPVPDRTTVAALVLLLVHVPPDIASLRIIVLPVHTFAGPVMAGGVGSTVTEVVVKQPRKLTAFPK